MLSSSVRTTAPVTWAAGTTETGAYVLDGIFIVFLARGLNEAADPVAYFLLDT